MKWFFESIKDCTFFECIKDGIQNFHYMWVYVFYEKKSLDAVFLVQNWMQSFMGLVFLSKLNKVQSFMKTKFFKAFFHANQTNIWYIRLQEEMYQGQNYHLEGKNRRKKKLPSIMNLPSLHCPEFVICAFLWNCGECIKADGGCCRSTWCKTRENK